MTSKVLRALPFALVLALAGTWAFGAAPTPPPAGAVELLRLTPTPGGGQAYSLTLQALGLITLLTLRSMDFPPISNSLMNLVHTNQLTRPIRNLQAFMLEYPMKGAVQ